MSCHGCGVVLPPGKGPRKFCEPNCGVPEKSCRNCGDVFTPDRYYQARWTCSVECKNAEMAHRNRTTQRINKPGGLTKAERAKIAKARSSQRKGDWYVKVDGVHEHRTVAEAVLGRPLEPGEVVHHEDQNKMNNAPENLIVFPQSSGSRSTP